MKKSRLAVLCFLVFLIGAPQAFSGEAGKNIGLGLHAGLTVPSSPTIGVESTFIETDTGGTSPSFGCSLDWFFAPDFSVSLGVDYCKFSIDGKSGGGKAAMGDATTIPVSLSLRYQPTLNKVFMPYIGIGGNYLICDFSESQLIRDAIASVGVNDTLDLENSFGVVVSGGLDLMVSDRNSVGIGLSYSWNNTKMEIGGEKSDSFDLNAFQASVGWKHYF
ncbi:MAG: OmpW family protein [Deltaproteobacteria bacterium]|nr:OmpW family protein [Deltaproteobacteria bacterium]